MTVERSIYYGMLQRCYNQKSPSYKNYGGRGITVCEEWRKSPEAFMRDIGQRPSPLHSIGIIYNDGPYSPMNCEWQTQRQQMRNTRLTKYLTYKGRTAPCIEWAEESGIKQCTIESRIRSGWTPSQVLNMPVIRTVNYCMRDAWERTLDSLERA
jgi:hypothetical protein